MSSVEAATLSKDGVSSQPREQEESSPVKTAKMGALVSWDESWDDHCLVTSATVSKPALPNQPSSSIFFSKEPALPCPLLGVVATLAAFAVIVAIVAAIAVMMLTSTPVLSFRMFEVELDVVLTVVLTLVLTISVLPACSRHGRGRGRGGLVEWGAHEWVLDSGASIHHTSNPLVALEDRNMQGVGSVRMERFEFPGVRYVAGDVAGDDLRNVVSVSQLARDHGLVTVFEPTSCHVKDKKTGQIVGEGRLRNGMYMLDYLRVRTVSAQYIGDDGGASSGDEEHSDGGGGGTGHGGRGNNNGEGDSGMDEGRGGSGGTGAITSSRNLEEQGGSGSGGAGDVNDEIVDDGGGDGSSESEIEEMNDNDDEDGIGEIHQETNGNGDDEDNRRGGGGGGPTYGESSSNKAQTGSFVMSRVAFGMCLCIAIANAILFLLYRSRPAGFCFILQLILFFSIMQPTTICKLANQTLFHGRSRAGEGKEGTSGDYVQESSQAHNRRLFGLSRFDGIRDPTGYWRRQRPAGAFTTSTNGGRWEGFLVDSGASFHMTWNESVLFHYPQHLQNHTKPPTWSCGGIAGSVKITRSGYLNGNRIMLDGVLLAPESQANLVSVGQLSTQYGVQVQMDEAGVIIRKAGVQVGGGQMLDNHHYALEYFQPPERLFAHSPTLHFKVFGKLPPSK